MAFRWRADGGPTLYAGWAGARIEKSPTLMYKITYMIFLPSPHPRTRLYHAEGPNSTIKAGHHRPARETPFIWMAFRWRADGGPTLYAGWAGARIEKSPTLMYKITYMIFLPSPHPRTRLYHAEGPNSTIKAGHHRPARETPLEWRFAGGPMVARHTMLGELVLVLRTVILWCTRSLICNSCHPHIRVPDSIMLKDLNSTMKAGHHRPASETPFECHPHIRVPDSIRLRSFACL